MAEQTRQFDITRADYAPLQSLLAPSIKSLTDLIGLNGDGAWTAALQRVQDSPILAGAIRNGEDAILANASATGGLRGGNIQNSLARFRGDAFLDELNAEMGRYAGLVGLGSGATDALSQFGAAKANNVSDLYNFMGQARANGIQQRGGINNQMWNQAGSFADSLATSFLPGGSKLAGLFK